MVLYCLVGRLWSFGLDVLPQFVLINSDTSTNLDYLELALESPLTEKSFRNSQDMSGLFEAEEFLSRYI